MLYVPLILHNYQASVASPSSDGADLPDDVANRMSLFYANPTPMLNTLSGATSKLLQEVRVCVCLCENRFDCSRSCRKPVDVLMFLLYPPPTPPTLLLLPSLSTEPFSDTREYDRLFLYNGLSVSSPQL